MSDVIIAIVPAPGHAGLVAEGPCGERPPLLYATGTTPAWSPVGPFETPRGVLLRALQATVNATRIQRELLWSDLPFDRSCVARVDRIYEWLGAPVALVLFAPGAPRLGMVRAMEAAFADEHEAAVVRWDGEHEGWLSDRDGETLCDWPVPQREGLPALGLAAYALAHLLHQRGLASEVLVLPVTP